MRVSRRKFLALCGAAAVSPALPAVVRGLAESSPAGSPVLGPLTLQERLDQQFRFIEDYLERMHPMPFPEVGDMIFLGRDGVYSFQQNGRMYKLSRDIKVEQRNPLYWRVKPNSGTYAGLERH